MDPILLLSLPLVVLLAVKFRAFKTFDELMEKVFLHHRERWEQLGRPIGYFWRPDDDTKTVAGVAARLPLTRAWLFRDPAWLPDDSPARLSLATWRVTTLLSWGGFLLLAGLAAAAAFT